MTRKKWNTGLLLLLLCGICCFSMLPVHAADGTDGSELQLLQAERLEIQLGPQWAGVQFQLKTDAGLYPGDITVAEDGVLRLEIGGSSFYTLSAAGSDVAVPAPVQTPATQESHEPETPVREATGALAGIPILHIVLFAGGLALASAVLIAMHINKKRAASMEDASDEERSSPD